MSAHAATPLEIRDLWNLLVRTEKALQVYIQGDANQNKDTEGFISEQEVDTLLSELTLAVNAVLTA